MRFIQRSYYAKEEGSEILRYREKSRAAYANKPLACTGRRLEDLHTADDGGWADPQNMNMQMRKSQVVKVNIDLWKDASRTERQWIQSNLVSTGLIQRTALIEGSGDADLLEIAEIDARVRRLEEKHAGSSCAGRCRRAYADAMLKCAGIFFADQRKRFKNAAYQAYALCLRQCTSQ